MPGAGGGGIPGPPAGGPGVAHVPASVERVCQGILKGEILPGVAHVPAGVKRASVTVREIA